MKLCLLYIDITMNPSPLTMCCILVESLSLWRKSGHSAYKGIHSGGYMCRSRAPCRRDRSSRRYRSDPRMRRPGIDTFSDTCFHTPYAPGWMGTVSL